MNNINFNQDGGFRLSTNIMAAVQASYSLFNALGWLGGNLTIINGCEVNGSSVSDGVVFINGEVLSFRGGNVGTNVIIKENTISYPFQNGTVKPVIYERHVTFGTSTPDITYPWANFKRVFQTKDIADFKKDHNDRITNLEDKQAFAVGMILRYDQPLDVEPPAGWVDWKPAGEQGRVWVSRSETDNDFALGAIEGEKTHTLKQAELPLTEGTFSTISPTANNGSGILSVVDSGNAEVGGSFSPLVKHKNMKISFGENKSHNNLQPYVAVRFIKYVGI